MISRSSRALTGVILAALLALPLVASAQGKRGGKKPAAPPKKAAGDAKKGMAAFKSEGCSGCHKTKDVDGGTMKDLSMVGKNHTAAQLTAFIKNPPASASAMPAFKGPAATLNDLVAYLLTQK